MTVTSHLPQVKTEAYRRAYQPFMARPLPNSPPSDLILLHPWLVHIASLLFQGRLYFFLPTASARYRCLPPFCPLCVFPHTHLLSEDFSILCRVGIPQPPSCLDLLTLLDCLQSRDYLLTGFLIYTCHREFCLSAS